MEKRILTGFTLVIYFAFFACAPTRSAGNDVVVNENTKNTEVRNYKKILVFSAGDMHFRNVTEYLYERLEEEFTSRGITSKFYYLGDDLAVANKKFRQMVAAETYDAIMLQIPSNKANVDAFYYSQSYAMPGQTFNTYTTTEKVMKLEQKAQFVIYDSTHLKAPVWNIEMDIDIKFQTVSGYKKVSKAVIKNLKSNKILNPITP